MFNASDPMIILDKLSVSWKVYFLMYYFVMGRIKS